METIDTKAYQKHAILIRTALEAKSKERAFGFLDLHKLTDRGDGLSNNTWHMDIAHISPDGMLEAWRRYPS